MKRFARFLTTLGACIAGSFAISILAIHAFYIGVVLSRSVRVARLGDAIGSVVLTPARSTLFLLDWTLGTSTILPEPRIYAAINGVIIGLCLYVWLQWKYKHHATTDVAVKS